MRQIIFNFSSLPKWRQILMNAGDSDKPITLPNTDMTIAYKALDKLFQMKVVKEY